MREAGWAKKGGTGSSAPCWPALRAAGLPAIALPADYQRHQTLVLKGPSTWVRYFVWALPDPGPASPPALYIPKGKHGVAVHELLLEEEAALRTALGSGQVLKHKDVPEESSVTLSGDPTPSMRTPSRARFSGVSRGSRARRRLSRARRHYATARRYEPFGTRSSPRRTTRRPSTKLCHRSWMKARLSDRRATTVHLADPLPRESASSAIRRSQPLFSNGRELSARRAERRRPSSGRMGHRSSKFIIFNTWPTMARIRVENAVAVCPNCHRLLHFGATRLTLKTTLQKKVGKK